MKTQATGSFRLPDGFPGSYYAMNRLSSGYRKRQEWASPRGAGSVGGYFLYRRGSDHVERG